jgi:hypothetical protein
MPRSQPYAGDFAFGQLLQQLTHIEKSVPVGQNQQFGPGLLQTITDVFRYAVADDHQGLSGLFEQSGRRRRASLAVDDDAQGLFVSYAALDGDSDGQTGSSTITVFAPVMMASEI